MSEVQNNSLKQGSYSEIWKIAYPLVIMNASHSIMQFFDRMFLAKQSTANLAAAMPGGVLAFTMFVFL